MNVFHLSLSSLPTYHGSKLGRLVEAIAVHDVHSWRGLRYATGFTERELNYHLAQLFNDGVLVKRNREYFLSPSLLREYLKFHGLSPVGDAERKVSTSEAVTGQQVATDDLSRGEQVEAVRGRVVVRPKLYLFIIVVFIVFAVSLHMVLMSNVGFDNTAVIPEVGKSNETPSRPPDLQEGQSIEPQVSPSQYPVPQESTEVPLVPGPSPPEEEPEPQPGSGVIVTPTPKPASGSESFSPEPESTPIELLSVRIDVIAECVRVFDGDTFELSNGYVVRLADVNCPERGEVGYDESTGALESLVLGRVVCVDVDGVYGTDFMGEGDRYVCVVYLQSGLNVNYELLSEGFAQIEDYSNEFNPVDWSLMNTLDLTNAEVFGTPSTSEPSPKAPTPVPTPEPTPEPTSTPTPEPTPTSTPDPEEEWLNEGPFWGSRDSDKYHKPSCYWAKQISPDNLIIFRTRREAIEAGYKACKVCKP